MQTNPTVGQYSLRPVEVEYAYGEGEDSGLPGAPWTGPISDEEREECECWRQFGSWWEEDEGPYPWWAYDHWEGWDSIEDAQPDFYPEGRDIERLGYAENWTRLSLQVIDAYAEQVIQGEEHDEWVGWILDVMETGAFLREVFGERKRRSL